MDTSNELIIKPLKSIEHINRVDTLLIQQFEKSAQVIYKDVDNITLKKLITLKNITTLEKGVLSMDVLQTSLDKLSNFRNDHKQQTFIYFPVFKKVENKININIALLPGSTQKASNEEIRRVIKKVFELSKSAILSLIKKMANNPLLIQKINPNAPGEILFFYDKSKNSIFSPNRFSFQKQISFFINRAFKINQQYIFKTRDTPLFLDAIVEYAESENLIIKIANKFYIIIDEIKINRDGEYQRMPEALLQYIMLLNALTQYSVKRLSTLSQKNKWLEQLNQTQQFLEKEKITDWKSNDITIFITLKNDMKVIIENFPYDRLNEFDINKIDEYHKNCEYALEALQNLENIFKINKNRKNNIILEKIIDSAIRFITTNTKQNKLLTTLQPEKIINESLLNDEFKNEKSQREFTTTLQSKFAYHVEDDNPSDFYFVDHGYLLLVQSHLVGKTTLSNESKKFLKITKEIERKYIDDPYLNSLLNKKQQSILTTQIVSEQKKIDLINQQKKIQKKYDFIRGFITTIVSIIVYLILLLIYFETWPIIFIIPIISYLSFLKKSHVFLKTLFSNARSGLKEVHIKKHIEHQPNINQQKEQKKHTESNKQFKKILYENIEKYCIPDKINKLQERIITDIKLLEHVEFITKDINSTNKIHNNPNYFLEIVEETLKEKYVVIPIPSRIHAPRIPNIIYINRADFFSDTMREKISQEIRENLEFSSEFQKEYLKYVINILEIEFYKYK